MAAVSSPQVPGQGADLSPLTLGESRPLPRRFYRRPSPVVARDLIGRLLVRRLDGDVVVARIVECEAYQEDDPASHSFRGRTRRTDVMFGSPGRLYVYFTYGMHFCMNVVTGRDGEGSAVLLRAAEPILGIDEMRARRRVQELRALCSGPARLTEAFAIGREHNGIDLVTGEELTIGAGHAVGDRSVGVGPRVGITSATDVPWRYFETGSPFVSRPRPDPSRRAAGGRPGRSGPPLNPLRTDSSRS